MDCAKASKVLYNLVLARVYRCEASVPFVGGSHGYIGCAENSDTDFLHYFSVVGIWTVHPPTPYLRDVGCTIGLNCAPSQGSLGIKEREQSVLH